MKTITFYSYKGGVGRTLALVNIAKRLAEFGKTVCLLDFDLEAPGLIHKYHNQIIGKVKQGLVDYIYEFTVNDIVPKSILEYSVKVWGSNDRKGNSNITLIPAGDSEKGDYWKKLSRINWWDLFYEDDSEGIPFFLDLKAKIESEIKPDYLLIDTRTGVTEVSSITMSLLADSIAIFAANNRENICGCQRIIETIIDEENDVLNNNPDIHFTLSRIPVQSTPEGKAKENEIVKNAMLSIQNLFNEKGKTLKSFNLIHSDREMELSERINIGYDFEKEIPKTALISLEYLDLFNSLLGEYFTPIEVEKFNKLKQIDELYERAYFATSNNDFIAAFKNTDKILEIDSIQPDVYILRGLILSRQEIFDKAIENYDKAIELNDKTGRALFFRGLAFMSEDKYSKALEDFDIYIKEKHTQYRLDAFTSSLLSKLHLNHNRNELLNESSRLIKLQPANAELLNIRSNIYRDLGFLPNALEDIYKAIELEKDSYVYYATLAEIKLCQEDFLDFYRNFDLALSKGYNAKAMFNDVIGVLEIYEKVFNDKKFISLLDRYNQFEALDLIEQWKNNNNQTTSQYTYLHK